MFLSQFLFFLFFILFFNSPRLSGFVCAQTKVLLLYDIVEHKKGKIYWSEKERKKNGQRIMKQNCFWAVWKIHSEAFCCVCCCCCRIHSQSSLSVYFFSSPFHLYVLIVHGVVRIVKKRESRLFGLSHSACVLIVS